MMKQWKVWAISLSALMVFAVIALFAAVWNNFTSEWNVESQAAQYALDNSPLNTIEKHDVFTASGAQEVFFGRDVFGRPWYTFVVGSPFTVQSVPAGGLQTSSRIRIIARQHNIHPAAIHLGYLAPSTRTAFHTRTDVAWEVDGTNAAGQRVYTYFNAWTGQEICSVIPSRGVVVY